MELRSTSLPKHLNGIAIEVSKAAVVAFDHIRLLEHADPSMDAPVPQPPVWSRWSDLLQSASMQRKRPASPTPPVPAPYLPGIYPALPPSAPSLGSISNPNTVGKPLISASNAYMPTAPAISTIHTHTIQPVNWYPPLPVQPAPVVPVPEAPPLQPPLPYHPPVPINVLPVLAPAVVPGVTPLVQFSHNDSGSPKWFV